MPLPGRDTRRTRVIVAGGGLAGLTTAKRLVDGGFDVELLEKRTILGGKVSSWRDDDGDWIESGLHTFFGAYVEIFDLMRELGIYEEVLWKEHELRYTMSDGDSFAFRTTALPSPFHLLPAVFENRYFSLPEKLSLARALKPILFGGQRYYDTIDRLTYEEWHRSFNISDKMLRRMFLPMTLALKFLPPDEISAKIVVDVSGTFLRNRGASRMGFLSGSPAEKLTGPLARAIERAGGRIRTGVGIRSLGIGPDRRVTCAETTAGERIDADAFVLALPIHNLKRLIPRELGDDPFFADISAFDGVPVITVQLWYDRQITGIDNILFCPDGRIPVYADLGNTTPDYAVGGRSRLEFVVAPAADLLSLSDPEIVARVSDDLKACFPKRASAARVVKSSVVRIPRSVYRPSPGLDAKRPTQVTPISNLFLAGGYTRQRFYDSMEGAVSSGNLAARALAARFDAVRTSANPPE
jgi:15-cis-phytoene desaturase